MSPRDTAKMRRAKAVRDESRAFAQALYETETTQQDVARALGRAASKVQRWTDPECAELPNAADIACMPEAMQAWYAKRDAERLGLVIGGSIGTDGASCWHEALAVMARESGELMCVMAEALRTGQIASNELHLIRNEARDVRDMAQRVMNGATVAIDAGRVH